MDTFSIWHVVAALVTVLLWLWPLWLLIARTGNPGALALLTLIPIAGLGILWWLALGRWPALKDAERPPMSPTPGRFSG